MFFHFKAVDQVGNSSSGQIDATDIAEVVHLLKSKGLTAHLVEPSAITASNRKGAKRVRGISSARTATVLFVRELATLLQAGVTLEEALRTLIEGSKETPQESALSSVLLAVLSGERFSSSLSSVGRDGGFFLPTYVVALITAGESTGDLAAALGRAADQMEFDEQVRAETTEALIYPTILVGAGSAAVLFVFSFVVPRFSSLLAGKNADLPWLSSAVLATGTFVNGNSSAILVGLGTAVIGFALLRRSVGPARFRAFLTELPVVGSWMQQQELSRWTGMLALMLQSRVPILTALELTAKAVSVPDISRRLMQTYADIGRGEALSKSLTEQHLLPPSALSMIRVGERTGQLGTMMGHVAAYALEQNRRQRRRLVALIEPTAILLLGGIIAVVIVGVVLALTSLSEVKI